MFSIYEISKSKIKDFELFLTSGEFEDSLNFYKDSFVIGVYLLNKPVGYLRLYVNKYNELWIMYIYVLKKYRRKKVGTLLINKALETYRENNFNKLHIIYNKLSESNPPIEKFFDFFKFSKPEFVKGICLTDRRILKSPRLKRAKIPEKLKVLRWGEVSNNLKAKLKNDSEKDDWEQDNLSPFNKESLNYIAEISFAVLKNDKIIGWLIATKAGDETLRYGNIYLRKQYRGKGISFALLYKAIKFQVENLPEFPYGIWTFDVKNQERVNFNLKRMLPYVKTFKTSVYRNF
ncbi:MAG: GNAT family N-acetyltransferase [Candidatus Muiribacteriota bacterium]